MEACETNMIEVLGKRVYSSSPQLTKLKNRVGAKENKHTANIGRTILGSTVGIEALGSPYTPQLET
jgi:hypothetical protein